MRAVARGPKKYPFAGSGTGGKAAAIACSLIETAKLNGADPNARLADTLARIADCKIDKVDDLLSWRWNRQRSDRTLAAEDQVMALSAQQAGRTGNDSLAATTI